MKDFFEIFWEYVTNGTIPSITTLVLCVVVVVLEVAKNKLINKNTKLYDKIEKLEAAVNDLKQQVEENGEATINTNDITSKAMDMMYVAYSNSKLSVDTKQAVQEIYNICPDGINDVVKNVAEIVEDTARNVLEETKEETNLEKIAKKLESE